MNTLPRPCPMCDKKNGTIQLSYFRYSKRKNAKRHYVNHDSWIIRIGHYDSESYKKARKEYDDSILLDKEQLRKNISTSQRKWCSFLSRVPLELDLKTLKPNRRFLNYIVSYGWKRYVPDRIARRRHSSFYV